MMATFEFMITDVFDLKGRGGLLVAGTVLQGAVRPGTVLRDAATGHSFALLGIDLACGRTPGSAAFALVVDRAERDYVQPGRIWVADEDLLG